MKGLDFLLGSYEKDSSEQQSPILIYINALAFLRQILDKSPHFLPNADVLTKLKIKNPQVEDFHTVRKFQLQ